MKPTFRQSINNMAENRNLWIVFWVKERCSQFHSIEVTLNKMSLFYFVQRNDQIKHEDMWEDFQLWLFFFNLDFYSSVLLEIEFSRATFSSMSLRKTSLICLDLTLSVASWRFVDFFIVLDVQAQKEEKSCQHSSMGSKS